MDDHRDLSDARGYPPRPESPYHAYTDGEGPKDSDLPPRNGYSDRDGRNRSPSDYPPPPSRHDPGYYPPSDYNPRYPDERDRGYYPPRDYDYPPAPYPPSRHHRDYMDYPPPPRDYYRDRPPRGRRYDDPYDDPPRRRYGGRGPPRVPRPRHTSRPVIRGSEEERKRSTTLWVGNLPYDFKEEDVLDLFERFGTIVKITIPIDRYTTKNKGFAFVQFEHKRDAEDAYDRYYGSTIEGRKVRIDWDVGLPAKGISHYIRIFLVSIFIESTYIARDRSPRPPYRRRSPSLPRSYSPGARDYSPPPPSGRDYSPRRI